MEYLIHGREPASLFRFFEELCAIPHPSYHEEQVADWLEAFAAARGLFCYRDALHNVLIKKPATSDRQGAEPLLLQGHTDMVCEKNGDTEHDFLRDPLKLFLDGDLLGARGTTLGGDDGIAVAMMLAILDGALSSHPPIECLFTVSEEVGLDGAAGFDYTHITARRMVNLDSEALGVVTCGCAGGIRSDLTLAPHRIPFEGAALSVSVTGLVGGHSGENINSGRANANKLMGRLLAALGEVQPFSLVSLTGGSKDNAIPRECEAILALSDVAAAKSVLDGLAAAIRGELSREDGRFVLTCREIPTPDTMLTKEDTRHAVAILAVAANGVFEMNHEVKGLVEFSRNLGVIRSDEEGITFTFSSRSGMEGRLDASVRELNLLAVVTGCRAHHHGRYPGWDYAPASPLRERYLESYHAVTGKAAIVNVIHAGLECGVIHSKLPDMDMISIGPTMHDIHSPDERLDLSATETFWKTLSHLIISL